VLLRTVRRPPDAVLRRQAGLEWLGSVATNHLYRVAAAPADCAVPRLFPPAAGP
jgi:hypothetical protein